jgi:glutaredoxin-like protein
MEKLLDENIREQVTEFFAALENKVVVLFFGSDDPVVCQYCEETHQLLEEVTELSSKLELQVFDIKRDAELAKTYHVDAVPAIVLAARNGEELVDYGIRYKGVPSGHEFTSLVNSLLIVSRRDSGLTKATREFLSGLDKPVHLQVFVTPT